jgi:hypothetical protein
MSTKQHHQHQHQHQHHHDSQLFLVRLWAEEESDGEVEWHGKLQHVVSGEAHTFRSCPGLIEVLLAMLQEPDGGSQRKEVGEA